MMNKNMSQSKKEAALEKITRTKLIPVFYHADPGTCKAVVKACYEGGIRVFEFTNRGDRAFDNFVLLKEYIRESFPGMLLGIGTVKDADTARKYLSVHPDFIVSPVIQPAIAPLCAERDLLWIPGCMTPTEIDLAERSGAKLVKLFPGNLLGPDYLKAVKELFPGILFMPTGGVEPTAESISKWWNAGVAAVGMGSRLITPDLMKAGDFGTMKEKVELVMGLIEAVSSEH